MWKQRQELSLALMPLLLLCVCNTRKYPGLRRQETSVKEGKEREKERETRGERKEDQELESFENGMQEEEGERRGNSILLFTQYILLLHWVNFSAPLLQLLSLLPLLLLLLLQIQSISFSPPLSFRSPAFGREHSLRASVRPAQAAAKSNIVTLYG